MSNPFSDPGEGGGDQLPITDLVGSLLLITVLGETEEIVTKFGPSTAIRADVAVLDGVHKAEVFADTLIFPRMLKGQLRSKIGEKVLGRLYQGENKKGNPPYMLSAATDADREVGTKYLNYVATQQPVASVPAAGAGGSSAAVEEEPFMRDATTEDI